MIREPGPSCVVLLARTQTSGWAGGTVSDYVADQPDAANGTLTFDRSDFMAFLDPSYGTDALGRCRWGGAIVRIDGTYPGDGEALEKIIGTVSITDTIDTPSPQASFAITDPRAAFYAENTLSWGERPVTIDLVSGRPGKFKSVRQFDGKTESTDTTGPYRAQGVFRAVGRGKLNADRKGCVRLPSFSGLTRGALLVAYIESAGVTVTNAGTIRGLGKTISKKVEIQGATVWEIATKLCELEGWLPRMNPDGSIEIITVAELTSEPPIFEFKPRHFLPPMAEVPPTHPTTVYVISASVVQSVNERTVTVSSWEGSTFRQITTQGGVETLRDEFEYGLVAAGGVTPGPVTYQIVKRTRTESTWARAAFADGRMHTTNMLASQIVTQWALTGTPAATSHGYHWTEGGWFVESHASLIETSQVTTTNAWNPPDATFPLSPCTLRTQTVDTWGLFSPLWNQGTLGVHYYAYPDGQNRQGTHYTFQRTRYVSNAWGDWRTADWAHTGPFLPHVENVSTIQQFVVVDTGSGQIERYQVDSIDHELWQDDGTGAGYIHTLTRDYQMFAGGYGTRILANGATPSATVGMDHGTGPVPGPPVGSTTVAQTPMTVISKTYDYSALPFRYALTTETLEFAEDEADMDTVVAWRMRRLLADRVSVTAILVPQLQVGDVVTVTDPKLNLDAVRGVVFAVSLSQEIATGKGRGVYEVRFI
jgi:hypothetical protein